MPINSANPSVTILTSRVEVAAGPFPLPSSWINVTIVPSVPIKPPGMVVRAPTNVETE